MKRLVLALALLVSGCGIQATGAVPMGPAPTFASRGETSGLAPAELVLFWVVDGHIQGVTRPSGGKNTLQTALTLLLKGPDSEDIKRGMVTFLPRTGGTAGYEVADMLTVKLPFAVNGLTPLAMSQVACTALTSLNVSGTANVRPDLVTLLGSDGVSAQRGCDG